MRKTKIICTFGPACRDEATIEAMLRAGMNVARMNFSHGDHPYHEEVLTTFRRVRDRLQLPAAVMLDTKGPEIRLGDFEGGFAELQKGDEFILTTEETVGDAKKAYINYKDLPRQLQKGIRLLIDDGRIMLHVEEIRGNEIVCRVQEGGRICNSKSVNVPYVHLDMPYLSEADKRDLRFGVEHDVDFVAASFVRSADDVIQLRRFLNYYGGHDIKIISKIENIEGIEHFDGILEQSDGIMIARGDMGVEVEYERLPGLQKKFIRKCYSAGKMVITATQMLESMISSFTPTRAEITDVANAIFDGTSAIMLSGETAIGKHPALVVKTMAKIAEQAERDAFDMHVYRGIPYDNDADDTTNAVCDAACTTARDVGASAIIAVTKSGYTARRASKFRPEEPIIAATYVEKTFHQMALSWGVYPVRAIFQPDANILFLHAIDCAKKEELVKEGDMVVITAGTESETDTLRVQRVPGNRK